MGGGAGRGGRGAGIPPCAGQACRTGGLLKSHGQDQESRQSRRWLEQQAAAQSSGADSMRRLAASEGGQWQVGRAVPVAGFRLAGEQREAVRWHRTVGNLGVLENS